MTQEPPQPSSDQPDSAPASKPEAEVNTSSAQPQPEGYGPPTLRDLRIEYTTLLKGGLIKALRLTSRAIARLADQLEFGGAAALPGAGDRGQKALPTSSLPARTASEAEADVTLQDLETAGRRLKNLAAAAVEQARPLLQRGWQRLQPYWERGWIWWQANALPKIRAALPLAINDALSDRSLSGAIAGILAVLLIAINSLPPAQPPKVEPPLSQTPTSVPGGRSVPARPVPTRPTPVAPTASPTPIGPSPIASPQPQRERVASDSTPPAASPSPASRLPDQPLIAAIQDQVSAVSEQYSSDLIQSVQANFRRSQLTVILSDGWYRLAPSAQDRLATELLKRANKLDFSKLELVTASGAVLARSPVVGEAMVILKRAIDTVAQPV